MDDGVVEVLAIAAAVVLAAIVSIAGFSTAKGTSVHAGRVGELTRAEWAVIETAALCSDAGGTWEAPPPGQPQVPGNCTAAG